MSLPKLATWTALAVLALETVFEWLRLSGRQAAFALALFVTASVVSSFIYFRQLDARGADQPYTDGTNDLVRRAAVVREVRDTLGRLHPTLAPSTVLLFNGLEIWSFGKDSGPHIWYGDSTIRAFAVDDLAVDAAVRRPSSGHQSDDGRRAVEHDAEPAGGTAGDVHVGGP